MFSLACLFQLKFLGLLARFQISLDSLSSDDLAYFSSLVQCRVSSLGYFSELSLLLLLALFALLQLGVEVRFLRGRVPFVDPENPRYRVANPSPSMLVIFRPYQSNSHDQNAGEVGTV